MSSASPQSNLSKAADLVRWTGERGRNRHRDVSPPPSLLGARLSPTKEEVSRRKGLTRVREGASRPDNLMRRKELGEIMGRVQEAIDALDEYEQTTARDELEASTSEMAVEELLDAETSLAEGRLTDMMLTIEQAARRRTFEAVASISKARTHTRAYRHAHACARLRACSMGIRVPICVRCVCATQIPVDQLRETMRGGYDRMFAGGR
eukprot:2238852-Pleurochrysis_carterae.AAC.3